ncbi:hypothetical protein FC679_18300 [Bacillus cereus]|uniref:Phage protein n=1 Tax=Bacillus cereus TIAC219 TaxID=718222 RepID=A0ABC9SZP1_BACCE|nr:hypothetical protein [Bacillus cereus]EOQ65423.1 hypothetical protein IAY_06708 [Bacillus cereus TIAC219]MCU4781135.1 hypothetical protein [Bacillus cereus]MCU4807502.1 hypothetical protein [Bacillus cereus]MCU4808711.1 hypothetical protein [Bacillus cereus]MCU5084657.1 hypothetical protein [Bacillus cereus]
MSILKTLHRRGGSYHLLGDAAEVKNTIRYTINFSWPGTYNFSFMSQVPIGSDGMLPNKYFIVRVNGIERFRARGPYDWEAREIFVGAGTQTIEFTTSGYGGADVAYIRDVHYYAFGSVPNIAMIEQTKLPKSLDGLKTYNVMHGYPRSQSAGNKGCEVEFTLLFNDISYWCDFMREIYRPHIITGDYGTYGGIIPPNEVDAIRKGTLVIAKCKLISMSQAGIGVDGM